MKKQRGFAAIVLVMIIGLVGLYLSLSLISSGSAESFGGRGKVLSSNAFYVAQSGVEDAFRRIGYDPDYGNGSEKNFILTNPDGSEAEVSVLGDDENRTIKSIGTSGRFVRRIETQIFLSEVVPGFLYAIQAGAGGYEQDGNSTVQALSGDGNVYSNGNIKGKNSGSGSCTTGSPSLIKGSVWAVKNIEKLTPGDGICVQKNASADNLNYCRVLGTQKGPNTPLGSCPGASYVSEPAPTPIPLPDMNIEALKDYLEGQTTFEGNCIADGSTSLSNCAGVQNELGNIIINGNLTINTPVGVRMNFNGPVWVKGTITFNSNTSIGLTTSTTLSQIVVSDKQILSNSNVTFCTNSASCVGGTAYLLFISTFPKENIPTPTPTPDPPPEGCLVSAITIYSNSNSVLFYAPDGCVNIAANSTFQGAVLGEKIVVNSNSTINYDPNLAAAIFGLSESGGWQTKSFKEF